MVGWRVYDYHGKCIGWVQASGPGNAMNDARRKWRETYYVIRV